MPHHSDGYEHILPVGTAEAMTEAEEVLVADARGQLTPAEMVDQKLMSLLWGTPLAPSVSSTGEVEDVRRVHD